MQQQHQLRQGAMAVSRTKTNYYLLHFRPVSGFRLCLFTYYKSEAMLIVVGPRLHALVQREQDPYVSTCGCLGGACALCVSRV